MSAKQVFQVMHALGVMRSGDRSDKRRSPSRMVSEPCTVLFITSKRATSSQYNDHSHSDDAMPWVMSTAARKYCGLLGLQRTASIADIKAAHRRVRHVLRERGLSARSQERVLAADLRTLLLGQCTPLEQDKCLEAIRAAGFATRESVLQAALPGQSTRVPTDEAPTLQAAELAASILDFIDGQCDWPEVLGVTENACGKEIKRTFYDALCCLKNDEYRESDAVMFGFRTMQDTIKSQRSDVFPKEKYVSSNPAERQYDKEFVKLNEDDDRTNDADEYDADTIDASDEDDEEFADTGSINTSDGDDEDLASTASMDASDDDEEDGINDEENGVNDDGNFCGMDFMYPECSDCDDEEEMKAEKL
ncbi:hypothetical protein D0867_08785 [Hortaea werneckii]|uniref:Uncharacterized protein n=1 Tax=Hortaea werneckii TaxID=91943 RepID=A0A3M6Z1J1_HORWE|nr:hypothetical protein D0867_08785 [Hortaea werneckii]RMY28707.1 hypothetical protein D0866_09222 [Hortaea werneckii]